jgi:hypothetical protein
VLWKIAETKTIKIFSRPFLLLSIRSSTSFLSRYFPLPPTLLLHRHNQKLQRNTFKQTLTTHLYCHSLFFSPSLSLFFLCSITHTFTIVSLSPFFLCSITHTFTIVFSSLLRLLLAATSYSVLSLFSIICITSHHMTSHHITSHHSTAHHITSYHNTAQRSVAHSLPNASNTAKHYTLYDSSRTFRGV